jgi:hypothetical protein
MEMAAAPASREIASSPSIVSDRLRCGEKLLAEVGITSADLRAAWAREALTAKNSLTATDAKLVEDTFERGLSEFPSSETAVQRFL